MDIDKVRELVRLMVDNDLAELDITDGENKIKLKRGGTEPAPPPPPAPGPAASVAPAAAIQPGEPVEALPAEELLEIKSPMVGTFYAAPSPEAETYVSVGTKVLGDTVVCIVEAMKVMNEIKAECAGSIVEICVQDAQPVEYGQVLFKVRPA